MAKWWRLERRPAAAWENRLLGWLTGPPLPKGASAVEQMRFVRRISVRGMLFYVPLGVVVLAVGTSRWATIFICVLILGSSANVLAMTLKVRRKEKAERETR